MRSFLLTITVALTLFFALHAKAGEYDKAIENFKSASATKEFFDKAYGYAIYHNIGKGGIGIGGAYGKAGDKRGKKNMAVALWLRFLLGFNWEGKHIARLFFFKISEPLTSLLQEILSFQLKLLLLL